MNLKITVSEAEFSTIMAALRFYQEQGQDNPAHRSPGIDCIATNEGQLVALDGQAIDSLCKRINTEVERSPLQERYICYIIIYVYNNR